MSRFALLALFALAAAPMAAAPAKPAKPAAQAVTCNLPVSKKDTFASLKARFGAAAVKSKLPGPEGDELNGVVLWGNDPARRLELIFSDDRNPTVSNVRIVGKSRWSAGGLQLGDGLARVQQVNGKPFTLYGFDWDYGGYVNELNKGKLAVLPGGCNLSIRFEPTINGNYPDGISGEVALDSTDPRVRQVKPVVDELSVGL